MLHFPQKVPKTKKYNQAINQMPQTTTLAAFLLQTQQILLTFNFFEKVERLKKFAENPK